MNLLTFNAEEAKQISESTPETLQALSMIYQACLGGLRMCTLPYKLKEKVELELIQRGFKCAYSPYYNVSVVKW